MSALPEFIDETWIIVGMIIFVLAALSHAQKMWSGARFGLGGGTRSPDFQTAEKYFEAWSDALSKAGFDAAQTDDQLTAPTGRGRLRGMDADIEMRLEATDGPTPDAESLNPASVHCRIDAEVALPFPHHQSTVRKFIRPGGWGQVETDDIDVGFELSDAQLRSVRLTGDGRRALAEMVDTFKSVQIIDGTAHIVDYVQPSRNTSRWIETFTDGLRGLRSRLQSYASSGLDLTVAADGDELEIQIEPMGGLASRRARLTVETDVADRWPEGLTLRNRGRDVSDLQNASLDDLFVLTADVGDARPPTVDDAVDEAFHRLAETADDIRITDGRLRVSTTAGSQGASRRMADQLDALVGAVATSRRAMLEGLY